MKNKNKVFNKIFTSIASLMLASSSVNPASIAYAIDTLNTEETWEVTDFKFNNSILTGLSDSGLNKLATDKTIDLPKFNTENILITEIGEKAFYDTNLEGINANGLTNIIVDKSAFQMNNIKGELDLSWVKDVNEYAFADNKIESVKSLPEEIKANSFRDNLIKSLSLSNIIVREYAFSHNNIESLTVEENVTIKDGSFSYNNLKSVNIDKSSNIEGNDVFGGNNQFVKIVSENTSIKSAKSTLGFGHVINPPVIKIKYIDSVTRKPLLSDETLGTDLTKEENIYIPGTEGTFSAKKIKGYLPVEESKTITISENENIVEFLYNTTKEKLSINASAKSYPLNTTVTEQMLLEGVTVRNSKGQNLQLKVKVDFSNVDSTKQGSYNITYSTEDEFGNSATLESIVNIGLDFGKIELGNGWLVEDFNYTSNTVTGFSSQGREKLKTNKDLVIPHITSSGAKVTSILSRAFYNNQLTNVVIPDSVSSIGMEAFTSNKLTNVVISNSVTSIGHYVFSYNQLTNVVIPDSVSSIGYQAFFSNRLTNVVIPDSVTSIGGSAFSNNQLTNVVIPDSVSSIEAEAFSYNQLTNVTIPNSVTSIRNSAFQNNQLTNVVIPNSVTSIGREAFQNNQLTNVVIPDSVTTIGYSAFRNNQLTNVVIPNSVTSIEESAFRNNQLTNVVIPNSVTTIGSSAFAYNQLTNVVIPDSVTSIGREAFYYNQLTNVTIPDSVTMIKVRAFAKNQLTNVVIPDSVTSVEELAFEYNQLTNVVIPDSVTSIGYDAFQFNKLTNVTIPNSVTSIGGRAFFSNRLTNVVISNSVTSIGEGTFANNQLTNVVIPDSVTSIGDYAFSSNSLTNVVISNSVTTIGRGAFFSNRLTNVVIPDSVTSIGESAFRNNQLTNIVIPDSVTSIGREAFQNNQLTNVVIPDSVTSIGTSAFANNQIGIENLKLSKNLQAIPSYGFSGTFIKNLDFSNTSITSIGDGAFSDRQEEAYYKVPDTLATIGKNVFNTSPYRNLPKFYSGKSYVLLEKSDPSPIEIDPSNNAIVEWSRAKIKYVDENGQELIPSQTYYIENNQEQIFVPQPIPGYRTPNYISLTGTERYKENEVVFVYNKLTEEEIKELNQNTDLLKFNLSKKTNQESYFIGKSSFGTAVSFDLSGFNTALVNPKIKIYYDASKIKTNSSIGTSSLVSSVDNNKGVITLNLKNLNSGTKLEYPIYYLFNELVTPQHTDFNISAEFYSDDKLIASAKPISFKGHYNKPTLTVRNKGSLYNGAVLAENLVDDKYTNLNQTMTYVYSTSSNRNVSEYTLTQKLPEYLDSSNQLKKAGFDETKNPGWKLSDDGNSVYYTKEVLNTNSIPLPELTLEFPYAQLEKNIKLDASISMTPYEKTKEEPIMKATDYVSNLFIGELDEVENLFIGRLPEGKIWDKEIISPRYSSSVGAYFYDTKTDRNKEFPWNLIFSTIGNNITSYKFNDYNLDERMYYTSLTIPSTLESTTVRLYDKNDLLLIEKEVNPGETFTFADEYKFSINRIEIEDKQFNSENKSSKTHYIILNSKLKEPQKNLFVDTNLSSANVFKNTASFEGTIENGEIPKSEETALVTVRELNQSVGAVKTSDVRAEARTRQDGNIVTFYLGTNLQSEIFEDEFENWRLIDLLPQSVTIKEIKLTDQFKSFENPRYKIIDNYNNTGRQAIIFSADKITNPSINVAEVKIQIEADTPEGESTNEVYLGFDNTTINKVNKDYIPNDPNTVYSKARSSFEVIKIKELTARKYIKSDTTPWSTTGVETLPYQKFSYKLAIFNNTDDSAGQIEIIDVLPIANDTSILPNQNGDYSNRLSEFKNSFNGIGNLNEIQDNYNVYYLNQAEPIDMEQTDIDTLSASTNWTTSSDSSTKAIKIVSKGVELEPKQKLEVLVNMTAPSIDYIYKYAYNTYAYKTSKLPQFIETNAVYNKVVPYKGNIKIIKKDSKSNELLENAVFGLYDNNVEIAKGITNSNGELIFENIIANDASYYTIRELSAPDGYIKNTSTFSVSGYNIRSSRNSNNEYEYTLTVTNNKYIPPVLGSISFTKVNSQGIPLKGVEFTLTGPNYKTYKATSTEDGKVFFGLLPLGKYTIKETNTNSILTMPINPIILTLGEQNKDVNLGNVVNDKATVKVSKIGVKDNFTKKELRSVNLSDGNLLTVTAKDTPAIFDLVDENNAIVQSDLIINQSGFVKLENLEFDKKYKLVEKQSPVKYITDIQVTYKPVIENLEFMVESTGNITDWAGTKFNGKEIIVPNLQEYSKSKVIINKSSNDGELLDNVEFTLFKLNEAGEEVEYSKTQTVNGQAVFEDLLFGNYVLKETSTNKNYLLSEETYRFNISKYNSKELTYEITNDKFNIGITKVTPIIKNLTISQEVEYKNFITNNSEKSGKTWEEVSNLIPSWAQNLDEEIKKEIFYKANSKISESRTELLMVLNGARFNLLDENKNILGTVTSDTSQDYIEFTNVSLDNSKKYYIEEVESPYGYLKLNHLIEVDLPQLTKAGIYEVKGNGDKVFNVNIINNKEYGSFFLTKYDAEYGNVIEGIEFTLYHKEKDGSFVKVESKTTNSSGSIAFNNLIIGDIYKVKETKSNAEYELDISQEKEFKASPYEATVFYNSKKVIMPTTGSNLILLLTLSGMSVILAYYLLRRKNII